MRMATNQPQPRNDTTPGRGPRLVVVPLPHVSGLDVGFAALAGAVAGATAASRRLVSFTRPIAAAVVLSPPLVPEPLQPRRVVERLAVRGSRQREELIRELAAALDRTVPAVVDEVLRRVDVDAVIARLDLAKLADDIIASVDLPELIRESTGAVSSETVREVRMRGISGDEAVGRAMDRLRPRRGGTQSHDGR